MEFAIFPITEEDREPIIDIFNFYILNSFAAYPEAEVPYEAFDIFLQKNGFYECGRFKGVGKKNDRVFDLVWMQKML